MSYQDSQIDYSSFPGYLYNLTTYKLEVKTIILKIQYMNIMTRLQKVTLFYIRSTAGCGATISSTTVGILLTGRYIFTHALIL